MIAVFEDEDLDAIARGKPDRSSLQTEDIKGYDKQQSKLKRRVLSSLSTFIDTTRLEYGYRYRSSAILCLDL